MKSNLIMLTFLFANTRTYVLADEVSNVMRNMTKSHRSLVMIRLFDEWYSTLMVNVGECGASLVSPDFPLCVVLLAMYIFR